MVLVVSGEGWLIHKEGVNKNSIRSEAAQCAQVPWGSTALPGLGPLGITGSASCV